MLRMSPCQARVLRTLSLARELPFHFPIVSLDKQEPSQVLCLLFQNTEFYFSVCDIYTEEGLKLAQVLHCCTHTLNCTVSLVSLIFHHILLSHEEFSTYEVLSTLLNVQNMESFRLQNWDFQIRGAQFVFIISQNVLCLGAAWEILPSPSHEDTSLSSKM